MSGINIFELAQAAYADSVNDVKNMAQLIEKVLKSAGQKYDYKITLQQFDILLQYSLLQIAVADNDIDKNEIAFIRELTTYGDLCNYLSITSGNKIEWDTILYASESVVKSLLNTLETPIKRLADEFMAMFVAVDKAVEYDFLGDLKNNVTAIILAACRAEGEARREELTQSCMIIYVINEIERLINK